MDRDLVAEARQLVDAFAKEWHGEFLASDSEIAGELLAAVLDYANQHVATQELRRLLQGALETAESHPYALTGTSSQATNDNGTPLPERK